ncbi:MAG: BamA/TamA family outer membrane protein, partial [Candidatus Marinimicrobia bacterium]|nr:BamA/TamA family outer membrane protein [Candidatus Neomarinimicrobiota bacterium]
MSFRRYMLIFIVILTAGQTLQAAEASWWKKDEPKIKVKSVTITGNTEMSDNALYQIMVLRPSRFLRPTIFHPDLVQEDLKSIIRYYYQQGYLYAEIVDHDETVDSVKSTAHLSITLEEGPRTFLESINLLGNAVFPDSVLLDLVNLKTGDPLLSRRIESATLILLRHYADAGYLDATIIPTTEVNPKTNLAILNFDINERQQFRIGKISLVGLEKTRENVFRRELLFHTGEVANYSKLLNSQRKIYLTGLAESVFVNPQPAADGDSTLKDILVEIKEVEAGEFNVSLGYGSLEHLRTSMEFHQNNLYGTARKVGIKGQLSRIQQGIEASFSEPWAFHRPWRSDLILIRENLVEPTYDLSRLGLRAAIGRNFTDYISLTFTYRDERNRLSNIQID